MPTEAATSGGLRCGQAREELVTEEIDPPTGVLGPSITTAVAVVDTAATDVLTPRRRRRFSVDAQWSHVRWGIPSGSVYGPPLLRRYENASAAPTAVDGFRPSSVRNEADRHSSFPSVFLRYGRWHGEKNGQYFTGKCSAQMCRRKHTVGIQKQKRWFSLSLFTAQANCGLVRPFHTISTSSARGSRWRAKKKS